MLYSHTFCFSTMNTTNIYCLFYFILCTDPGFQVRGGGPHLRKLRRAEGVAKIFGVFRVKNHDLTSILWGARRVRPPWIRPWDLYVSLCQSVTLFLFMYMQFFILPLHWKYTICILVNIIRETHPLSLCYK
jgi:hypothetical protein